VFDYFVLAYHLIREAIIEGKLGELFKQQIFRNRIVIPVEMDLLELSPSSSISSDQSISFIELQPEDVHTNRWKFLLESRRVKASRNLKRGMRGFALLHKDTVIGDLWSICRSKGQAKVSHPDFKMLQVDCREQEAYAFDMFLDPAYRGKNLAILLHQFLHQTLKKEGYVKVYGAYYEDNRPALWMHRMLKFKEHPKRQVFRLFFFLKSIAFDTGNISCTLASTTEKGG
jgi:GNAT superfamily N-acetyltransferase